MTWMPNGHFLVTLSLGCLVIGQAFAGPIHQASKTGDIDAVTRLLDQGVSVEDTDATGETPLLSASLAGQTRIVELLLARHADIEARNDRGLTPLHAAAYGGHVETVVALIQHGAKVDDTQNRYKTTALIVASEEGCTEIVKLLLDHGADIEAKEANGFTALTQAGSVWHWDTVDALIQAGAACQPKEIAGEWWWVECNKRKK
jgi:ankyrin repeat protein